VSPFCAKTLPTTTISLSARGSAAVGSNPRLDEIEGVLPFRLLGLDLDNGSESTNWHPKGGCERKTI
jgi:hypothetical protein